MPSQTNNSPGSLQQPFWSRLFAIFAILICSCQAENSQSTLPNSNASQQLIKPPSRSEWRKLLNWNDDCEHSFSSTQAGDYAGIETYTLGDADLLVVVMCAVGSYQPSFYLYRLKEQIPNFLALDTYLSSDGVTLNRSKETELWGEPFFNANTKELVILNAARQTKDCGTWAKYSFSPDNTVKLQDFRVKLPCPDEIKELMGQEPVIPPEGWKTVNNR